MTVILSEHTCHTDSQGNKKWELNGKLHRVDGPAKIWADGSEEWYQNGKRHRENGPAIIWSGRGEKWFFHGEVHRVGGPAFSENDMQTWWYHGMRHRVDGPAVIRSGGSEEWWLFGEKIKSGVHTEFIKHVKNNPGSEGLPFEILQVIFDEFLSTQD